MRVSSTNEAKNMGVKFMGTDSLKVGLKWSLVELQVTASGSSQPPESVQDRWRVSLKY